MEKKMIYKICTSKYVFFWEYTFTQIHAARDMTQF